MTDIWLKLTGTPAQARAALIVMDMHEEVLHGERKKNGKLKNPNQADLAGFNYHVATIFHENLMTEKEVRDEFGVITKAAVFSGPYLMMRLVSDTVRAKALEKIIDSPALPAGLELVSEEDLFPFGPTIVWA